MELTSQQLVALRQIVRVASADDLARTYCFEHPLNAERTLSRAWLEQGHAGSKFRWHILVFEPGGPCILENDVPIARKVVVEKLASASGHGLAAWNDTLFLADAYQKHGFATALYAAEEKLYRRWGVREIRLHAQRDGLAVWLKPQFGFRPVYSKILRHRFNQWSGSTSEGDPVEYPEEFLRLLGDVPLYKIIGS